MTEKDVSQKSKFIEKARELGCDEDEKAFDDKLRRIGGVSPQKTDEEVKPLDK